MTGKNRRGANPFGRLAGSAGGRRDPAGLPRLATDPYEQNGRYLTVPMTQAGGPTPGADPWGAYTLQAAVAGVHARAARATETQALALVGNEAEGRFLRRRLAELGAEE